MTLCLSATFEEWQRLGSQGGMAGGGEEGGWVGGCTLCPDGVGQMLLAALGLLLGNFNATFLHANSVLGHVPSLWACPPFGVKHPLGSSQGMP